LERKGEGEAMSNTLFAGVIVLAVFGGVAAQAHVKHSRAALNGASGAGASVENVVSRSAAARAGILPGDRIVAIGGRPIDGYADVDALVA
jgi:S1-C subfamily serine protease